ncbi:MAG: hypothetical protein ACTS4U_00855 [Candidatus Hodgkinia cicadicola]
MLLSLLTYLLILRNKFFCILNFCKICTSSAQGAHFAIETLEASQVKR